MSRATSHALDRVRAAAPVLVAMLVASAVLGVAAYVDRFASHGYVVSWYADRDGERYETARTVEHRVVIPNGHRPMSRVIEGWDFAALGVPTELPPLDATLRTALEVPPAGRYLHAAASGTTGIRIDGHPAPIDGHIDGGFHRVEIEWHGDFEPLTHFELEWGPSAVSFERVPSSAIWPIGTPMPTMRWLLWIGAVLLAAAGATAAYRLLRASDEARPRLWHATLVAVLVLLTLGYRAIDYEVMPDWRDNSDEQLAAWNGYSLLAEGRPRSWTLWPGDYGNVVDIEATQYFGRNFHVISPYFEHPPLTHLLVGAAAHLGGAHGYREVRISDIRLVPILLAALNAVLIVLVGRRLDRRRLEEGGIGPYLGALLYAVLPTIVIQTRVVKEEVLLTTMMLGCIWFFLRFRASKQRSDLAAASVIAGLAILTKVPGFALVIALSILVLREAGPSALVYSLAISLPLSTSWLLFGALYDLQAFFWTQHLQTSRVATFVIFERFFDVGMINNNLVGRGWSLFLWLGTFSTLYERRRDDAMVIAAPLVAYLAAIALGSGGWTYGWYITPLLPWLALGSGLALADLWRKPDLGRGALFVFLLVFYTMNFAVSPSWIVSAASNEVRRPLITGVLLGLFGPFALATALPSKLTRGLARVALVAGLVTVMIVSAVFVARYDEVEATYHDFDRDERFGL